MAHSKRKVTINLPEDLVDALHELAKRNDTTLTDEIRKAIQDRKYFADKIDAGNDVVLERQHSDTLTRTLVDLR